MLDQNGKLLVKVVASLTGTGVVSTGTSQTIVFPSLTGETYGAAPVNLTATATSGLPVSYTVTGPATLSGSTLTLTGAGTVAITATQPGNATFAAANPVSRSFTVIRAILTVTAESLSRPYGAANPALNYAATGFVNGDTDPVVTGTATLTTTATSTSPAGSTYPITFSTETLSATNYSFRYAPGVLTVLPTGTTTSLVASPKTHLVAGQPITLTATVVAASGTAIPTGTITFEDPEGVGVTVRLDRMGNAVYTGVVPPAGIYSVFAHYNGAAGFARSSSATMTETVTAP